MARRVTVNDNNQTCMSTPVLQSTENGAQFRFSANNADAGAPEAVTRTVLVTVNAPAPVTTPTHGQRCAHRHRGQQHQLRLLDIRGWPAGGIHYVAAPTWLPGFTNQPTELGHAYVRNLTTGVTTLINQTPGGAQSSRGVAGLRAGRRRTLCRVHVARRRSRAR